MIPLEYILATIGGSVAFVTAVWHAGMWVGRLSVRLERVEHQVNDHEEQLDRHGKIINHFKGVH